MANRTYNGPLQTLDRKVVKLYGRFTGAGAGQVTANSWLADVIESMNLWATWSDSQLKLIPLCDEPVSGNGVAYFPPTEPEYDLADEDFLPNQSSFGGSSGDPVSCQILPPP